jgi:hypothetical protein
VAAVVCEHRAHLYRAAGSLSLLAGLAFRHFRPSQGLRAKVVPVGSGSSKGQGHQQVRDGRMFSRRQY